MCTKLFSDELAWNPFCTIKPWQKLLFSWCSFCGSFSEISVLFSCNPLYTKVASWKTFSVLYVRTVNSIICAVAEDFCVYLLPLKRRVWMIHKSSISDEVSVMISYEEVQRKLFLLFCLLKKNLHFCNKRNRQPQKHAKVTYTYV